jgi:hypothetical protein
MRLPRLVYVASIGRSGSTLLELLLGAHPDVVTTGELHLWPHELGLKKSRLPCGCGLPLEECPFWTEMARRHDPREAPPPQIHYFREDYNHGHTLRMGRLGDFARGRRPPSADIRQFGVNNAVVFENFADLTEEVTRRRPDYLVDSSKDPYRLNWLIRSGMFDIKVLHVVRDPRGFVNSERKNVGDIKGARLLALATRKSGAWALQNHLVRRSARLLPDGNYRLVEYERLATSPREVLEEVCATLGCAPAPEMIDGFRERRFHAVGGNPMRHRPEGIKLDEAWREQLGSGAQRLTRALTTPTRWMLK